MSGAIQIARTPSWPRIIAVIVALYALVAGVVTFAGWALHMPALADWEGAGISMKTNPALAAIAASIGILLATTCPGTLARRGTAFLGAFAALIGLLTIFQHLTGYNLGIDTLLFNELPGARATAAPNRMGLPGSTCFLLIGTALVLLTLRGQARQFAPWLAVVACGIASLSVIGRLYRAEGMYATPGLTGIAAHTASILLALGAGVILSVPEHSPTRRLIEPGTTGLLIRLAAPVVILLPLLLGWLKTLGEQGGMFDPAAGLALLVLLLVVLLLWLLLRSASIIRTGEDKAVAAERSHAQRIAALAAAERESRAKLETVLDTLTQPLAILDGTGAFVRMNPAFQALHRLTPDAAPPGTASALPLSAFAEHIAIFDVSRRPLTLAQWPGSLALRGESTVGLELQIESLRGDWSFAGLVNAMPLRDGEGAVIGAVLTIEDITKRRRVEESLRQNEALFSALVDLAPVGVYVVDDQMRLRQVNPIAAPTFAQVTEPIGRDFNEIMEILWGPEVGAQCVSVFRHTLLTGERYISPPFAEHRYDLGIDQVYEWETQRIRLPDDTFGVVCYFREITERMRAAAELRSSEARLAMGVQVAGLALAEIDYAADVYNLTTEAARLFGVGDAAVTVARQVVHDTFHPDDRPEVLRRIAACQDPASDGTFEMEHRVIRPDGEERWLRVRKQIAFEGDGPARTPCRATLVAFDITAQKRAEAVLANHHRVLEQRLEERTREVTAAYRRVQLADRMAAVGSMAAGLTHDINNLLLPLRMHMDFLLSNPELSDEVRADLKSVSELLTHLREMARNLSLFSRDPGQEGTEGRTDLSAWHVEVQGLMKLAVSGDSRGSKDRGPHIPIEWNVPAGLPPVAVSPHRLTQAIFNLASNARHAIVAKIGSPEASSEGAKGARNVQPLGLIRIVARLEPDGKNVRLSVHDTGCGMDEHTRRRCLEPFFTTRDGRAPHVGEDGGSGLGMALVHTIAERAGGRIDIESEPENGTTISLTFPVAPAVDATANATGRPNPGQLVIKSVEQPMPSKGASGV